LKAAENPETINPIQNKDYAGIEVSALYNNGTEVTGNLLSATSSSVIIYSLECDENSININCATLIKTNDLEKLSVKNEFNLGSLLYPTILGIAAMLIYNSTLTPEEKNWDNMTENLLTGLAVGVGGMLVGIGISYAIPLKISSEEDYAIPLNEDEIEGLSKIARYKDFEPYYKMNSK
jgi:hypothetical protein